MKILKKGRLPDKTLVGECGNCSCRVECLPGEPDVQTQADRNDTLYFCNCPTDGCPERIWLDRKKPEPEHYDSRPYPKEFN